MGGRFWPLVSFMNVSYRELKIHNQSFPTSCHSYLCNHSSFQIYNINYQLPENHQTQRVWWSFITFTRFAGISPLLLRFNLE